MKPADENQSLQLAAATVNVALKFCVGPLEPVAGAVIELLKKNAQSALERRQAERLIGNCEDLVAKRILNNIEHSEYRGLEENEINAALGAVCDTINAADYGVFESDSRKADGARRSGNRIQAMAVEYDFSPASLEKYLESSAAGRRVLEGAALNDAAEGLYRLILRETCHNIITVFKAMPGLNSLVLPELLRRDTKIIAELQELLDRTPLLRSATDFESDYRRAVINRLDSTEIFGITGPVRRYPLTVGYISLAARSDAYRAGTRVSSDQSVEVVLAGKNRVFVSGNAGSGKTTLLQWLAVRCARRDLAAGFSYPDGCVPFLISLRRYATRSLPRPEQFISASAPEIVAEAPSQWVHKLLRAGRGIVLVDGLDEVPDGRDRHAAVEWIEGLMNSFPESTFIITSRPGTMDPHWLSKNNVSSCDLLPMAFRDVREFVVRWHAAARESLPMAEQEIASLEGALVTSIESDRHLRLLAVNPLLCALLCTLNSQRRGHLPREKVEVYTAALDMLLGRRDLERGISSQVDISVKDQIYILQNLAFWFVKQGWSYADKARVEAQIARSLAVLHSVHYSPQVVLNHLASRSGVLREPVEGQIDFIHRTFQEYLAGKAACDDDEIRLVVANAHDDNWREVVLMAAAHARPRACEELIAGLLARHRELTARGPSKFSSLLVRVIGFAHYLPPKLTRQIERLAPSMVPPKTYEDAADLEPMGDLVIDLMAGELPLATAEIGPSIRAVSLVGGPKALKLISKILDDVDAVDDRLLEPWPYFEVGTYAAEIFPTIGSAVAVTLGEAKVYPYLELLRDVRSLHLVNGALSLTMATAPPCLRELRVTRRARVGLDGIERFTTVESLTIELMHTVPTLEPLRALIKLKKLRIQIERPISARVDLAPLRRLRSLAEVEVVSDGSVVVDAENMAAKVTVSSSTL